MRNQAEELARRAQERLDGGDLVNAVRDSNRAVALKPGDKALYRVRRRMIRAFKDACRSPQGLAKVVRADPNLVWFYNERFEADCCWGRFDKVLDGLDRELKAAPSNARALALKGEVLRMPAFSRFAEGLACLERAASLSPRTAWIRAFLGRARLYSGAPGGAVRDLRRAAALDGGCGWIKAWLGEARYMSGDHRGALAELDRAAAADPECAVALAFRGASKERLGRFKDAVRDLDRALELHKRYAEVYVWPSHSTRDWEELVRIDLYGLSLERGFVFYERSRCKRGLGDWDSAVDDMTQALLLDPKYHWLEGAVSRKALEGVLRDLGRADPRRAWTNAWRGEILLRLDRPQEALVALKKAVRLDARCAWAWAWLAESRLRLGDAKAASTDAARAARLDKNCARAYAVSAQAWQAAGKPRAARRALDRLLKRDPKLAWAFCWRGEIRLKLGDPRGAWADLDRAVHLHPGFADAYFWRAEALRALGKPKAALEDLDHSLSLRPGNALARLSRGVIRGQMGDARGSLEDFARARRLDPGQR